MDLSARQMLKRGRQGIRDVGYGIRDTWVDPAEAVPEIAPKTGGRGLYGWWRRRPMLPERLGSFDRIERRIIRELQTHRDHVYAHETYLQAHQTQLQLQSTLIQTQHQVHETRFQMQQAELAALRETDRRRQDQMRAAEGELDSQGPEARIPDHQEASGDADSHI
ncbi:hypothetical protein Tco_0214984 [Tanacetum coccineum]